MCALKQVPVAVIGSSRNDVDQNGRGIGKSSFCSRFVLPAHDDYRTVRDSLSSCISEADFLQREVNRCHFLYFPPVRMGEIEFHVVEQTTLICDTTLRPFSGSEKYTERATRLSLRSDGKVAYTSRDHIGTLSDTRWFPSEVFEKVGIKGFICLIDPTLKGKAMDDQVTTTCELLSSIQSKKKKMPVVLTLSKCDVICEHSSDTLNYDKVYAIAKQFSVPVMYSSAHENLNVREVFLLLGQMIVRKASPSRVPTLERADFVTVMENHREKLRQIDMNYSQLLEMMVRGIYVTWSFLGAKLNGKEDFEIFKAQFGGEQANIAFKAKIMLIAMETSLEVIDNIAGASSIRRQCIVRDLLRDHEDIGFVHLDAEYLY